MQSWVAHNLKPEWHILSSSAPEWHICEPGSSWSPGTSGLVLAPLALSSETKQDSHQNFVLPEFLEVERNHLILMVTKQCIKVFVWLPSSHVPSSTGQNCHKVVEKPIWNVWNDNQFKLIWIRKNKCGTWCCKKLTLELEWYWKGVELFLKRLLSLTGCQRLRGPSPKDLCFLGKKFTITWYILHILLS